MEVQPINIQLNTSTDDESEPDTSLFKEATSSTPKSQRPLPTEFAVNLFDPANSGQSDLTPMSAPFQPALDNQQVQNIYTTEWQNYDTNNQATNGTLVRQVNDSPLENLAIPYVIVNNGSNGNECVPYVIGQYPYPDYQHQATTLETYTPEVSESTVSTATGPPYELGTWNEQYAEQSNSGIAISSNGSPVPEDFETNDMAAQYGSMVFPSLMVSSAGLLTVFLKYDMAVELTLDRAIRLVNNRHRAVVATNNHSNASCIHHPAAKIYQEGNITEAELFWGRRAKMCPERALFSFGHSCFQLADNQMRCALPEFSELENDMSVTILFSSSGYGPHLTHSFENLVSKATYRYYKNGGISVWINGVKIQQDKQGDVTVTIDRKFLRASPHYGTMYIETPFLLASVEADWNIRIQRGDYRLLATLAGMMISDGSKECGFDQYQQVFIQSVRPHKQQHTRNGMSVAYSNRRNRYENNRYVYNRYQNYCSLNNNNHNYAARGFSSRPRNSHNRTREHAHSDDSSHSLHNSSEDVSQELETF